MCLLQIGRDERLTKKNTCNKTFPKDYHQFLHPPSLLPLQHRLELGDSHGRPHVPGRSTKLFRFLRDLLDLTQHLRHLTQHVSSSLIDLLTFWFLAFKDSTESSSSRSLMVADWTLRKVTLPKRKVTKTKRKVKSKVIYAKQPSCRCPCGGLRHSWWRKLRKLSFKTSRTATNRRMPERLDERDHKCDRNLPDALLLRFSSAKISASRPFSGSSTFIGTMFPSCGRFIGAQITRNVITFLHMANYTLT